MFDRNFYYGGEERLGGGWVGLPNLCAGEEGRRSESALSKGKWGSGLSPEGFLVFKSRGYHPNHLNTPTVCSEAHNAI